MVKNVCIVCSDVTAILIESILGVEESALIEQVTSLEGSVNSTK